MTTKEEALEGFARVDMQRARLATMLQNTMHKFMKPETRDPAGREIENREKALAVLWLTYEMQETIKKSLTNSGIKQESIENAIRLFKQEARK